MQTTAGIFGFKIIAVDGMTITVEDGKFPTNKRALKIYKVGDTLQYDASKHYYDSLAIAALSSNSDKNTVITLTPIKNGSYNLALDSVAEENYVWVKG
jgi:hypothetical protein